MAESKIKRSEEITNQYFAFLDKHIEDVVNGQFDDFLKLNQIAQELYVSHTHLSDTIQQTTGHHPCHFYDLKIVNKAKSLLVDSDLSIAEIAKKLTYDPSNLVSFLKNLPGKPLVNFGKSTKNNFLYKSSEKFTMK
ncbi:AraC family transcriptional regulator [Siphonobacter sp. SORGH_AS_0500]|uniref:helix-turn-helix domain-containing protein n=1 Tax=Siphonobacter sp. SORGH_AS_0500 TaxID=1864824 RepID=UPI0018E33D31|nr:AraC family transcriptional regulator [Siphonobacter sp. SORGH_AS_0500]